MQIHISSHVAALLLVSCLLSICTEGTWKEDMLLALKRSTPGDDECQRICEAELNGNGVATTVSPNNCLPTQFQCASFVCISGDWHCDGDNDCGDGSDEVDCDSRKPTTAAPFSCTPEQFQCANNECIRLSWQCDDDKDCSDGSDELNCTCPEGQYKCENSVRCIGDMWICDGDNDCEDGSDEVDCPTLPPGPISPMPTCEDAFTCDNGGCVRESDKCDGENHCEDGSDERDCPTTSPPCPVSYFQCDNGNCVPNNWKCDGDNDCGDRSDETGCYTI